MFRIPESAAGPFPRAVEYRREGLVAGVFETPPDRTFPWKERHLQCIWADARHRPCGLATTEGEPVMVEHPGAWNLEAGPDFLHAALLVGREKRRICGDLEIHINAADWHRHGHADDPRYENVRFHVVYFQGLEIPGLLQIPLQQALAGDPRFSFENIDTTAYPYSIPSGDYPLKAMHPDAKTRLLESAGEERLRLKAERLALAMESKEPEQVLWEELLAALGYKNNKIPCRQLAMRLPLSALRSRSSTAEQAYALLLGLSGLLPAIADSRWDKETRSFFRRIWDFWWKQSADLKERALDRAEWVLSGIRPANHPVRRLMAAAHYALRIRELVDRPALLTDFPDNFWNTHISWKTACAPMALVGRSRANAIITNLIIPYCAATGGMALELDTLPVEPLNSIIRETAHALFGPDHPPSLYRSALARQGLIQIFHDYLITHRIHELQKQFERTASPPSA